MIIAENIDISIVGGDFLLFNNEKLNVNCNIDEISISLSNKYDYNHVEWNDFGFKILNGIENELGLTFFEKIVDTNLQGYDYTERFLCNNGYIKLAFHTGRPDQGILVKFSAAGLREYVSYVGMDVSDIVKCLQKLEYVDDVHFSRLDFAVDFFDDGRVDLTQLKDDIKNGLVGYFNSRNQKNRLKMKFYHDESTVQSIYFGARTSDFMLRCYDKKAQQLEIKRPEFYDLAKESKSWVRFEAEIKHDLARKLTNIVAECKDDLEANKKLAGLVLSRFVFRMKNGEYHFVSKVFQKISNGYDCDVVVKKNDHNQDLEKSKDWYKSDNAGLIGMLYKLKTLYGEDEVKQYFFELYECLDEYKPTQSVVDWLQKNRVKKKSR